MNGFQVLSSYFKWIAFINIEMQVGAFRHAVAYFSGIHLLDFTDPTSQNAPKPWSQIITMSSQSNGLAGSQSQETILMIMWPQHAFEISFKTLTRSFIAQRDFINVTIVHAVKVTGTSVVAGGSKDIFCYKMNIRAGSTNSGQEKGTALNVVYKEHQRGIFLTSRENHLIRLKTKRNDR